MNKSLFVSMIALVLTIGFMGCEPGADDSGRVEPQNSFNRS